MHLAVSAFIMFATHGSMKVMGSSGALAKALHEVEEAGGFKKRTDAQTCCQEGLYWRMGNLCGGNSCGMLCALACRCISVCFWSSIYIFGLQLQWETTIVTWLGSVSGVFLLSVTADGDRCCRWATLYVSRCRVCLFVDCLEGQSASKPGFWANAVDSYYDLVALLDGLWGEVSIPFLSGFLAFGVGAFACFVFMLARINDGKAHPKAIFSLFS